MLRRILGKFGIGNRVFLVITLLFLSTFGWYYMTMLMINSIISGLDITPTQNLAIWTIFYFSIIGFSIIGAFLSRIVDRIKFLYSWTFLGVIVSFLPVLLTNITLLHVYSMSLLLGASFGLGMPSCLAYFTEFTDVENRGRIGSITLLIAIISVPLFTGLFEILDLTTIWVIFGLLRGTGLVVFFLKPKKHDSSQITSNVSFFSILRDRTFQLYFVAWSMFLLVDSFEKVRMEPFLLDWMPELIDIMYIVEPLASGFSILVAGLLCDWIGRKKIVLSGFIALGIAYGIIGLAPYSVLSWYLYFIVDGIAWGIFLLLFVIILWGDLAKSGSREKYFTMGSIPYFLNGIIPLLISHTFITQVSEYAIFSLASFFLFAAVMPLFFAPETFPRKNMELRRLRSFADEARKAKEKYKRKMNY